MEIGSYSISEPIPQLNKPHLISVLYPWIDAGSSATLALSRIRSRFASKHFAELKNPSHFFDMTRYRPNTEQKGKERKVVLPNTKFWYGKLEGQPDMLFCELLEPHAMSEDYAKSFIEMLKFFDVKRHIRIGSMLDTVPHTRPLRLTGNVELEYSALFENILSPRRSVYEGPTSITMALLTEEQKKLGIETNSFMLHLPQYLDLEKDYSGAAKLIEALSVLYGMPIECPETSRGRRQYEQITKQLSLEANTDLRKIILKLEEMFDKNQKIVSESEQASPLSPEIEQFIKDLETHT
jgi:hypothetical protein